MKRLPVAVPDKVKEKMVEEKEKNGKPFNRIVVEALKKRYGLK